MNYNRNCVKKIILTDVYNDWREGGGIFSTLSVMYDLPWNDDIDGLTLDYDYYTNHSGTKVVSELLSQLVTEEGLSNIAREQVAKLIYAKYGLKWKKQWETMFFEYDPISNYDKTSETTTTEKAAKLEETKSTYNSYFDENGKDTRSGTDTDTTQYGRVETSSGSDKNYYNGKEQFKKEGSFAETQSGNMEVENVGKEEVVTSHNNDQTRTTNERLAYNSAGLANWNGTDRQTTDRTGTETVTTEYGADGSNRKETSTYNDVKNETSFNNYVETKDFGTTNTRYDEASYGKTITLSNSDSVEKEYDSEIAKEMRTDHKGSDTITKERPEDNVVTYKERTKGNIGVTTSQQMITSERELWDYKFFDEVFKDVDSVLTIGTFGESNPNYLDHIELRLPIATATKLGGVKAIAKTNEDIQVAVDEQGRLWTKASASGGGVTSFNGMTGDVIYNPDIPEVPENLSAFRNDVGYLTPVTGVTSVNGEHGDVTLLIPVKLSDLTNDEGFITLNDLGDNVVTSFNGHSGEVSYHNFETHKPPTSLQEGTVLDIEETIGIYNHINEIVYGTDTNAGYSDQTLFYQLNAIDVDGSSYQYPMFFMGEARAKNIVIKLKMITDHMIDISYRDMLNDNYDYIGRIIASNKITNLQMQWTCQGWKSAGSPAANLRPTNQYVSINKKF